MHAQPRSSRIAAAALIGGPALYLAAETISAAAWNTPSYSYLDNWVSDLGSSTTGVFQGREIDSPLYGVMNAGFLVQGLLFAVGLLIVSTRLDGLLRRTGIILTIGTTIGYVLLACFHGSAQAAKDGTLALHFLGATLAILGANTLAIVLGLAWRRNAATRQLGRGSIALGVVALIAVVVLFSTMGSGLPAGMIERVSVYISVFWPVGLAVQLLRSSRPDPDQSADATVIRGDAAAASPASSAVHAGERATP